MHCKYISIYMYIQQDATLHSLFLTGNCSTCFGWKYHPKHVEQFPDTNKLCNVASCWIYIGILLGAHPILHISRIRVNAHSAVKFVETILGFCFKLDSLHTHTSLMQYYFKKQCYRGNDLL